MWHRRRKNVLGLRAVLASLALGLPVAAAAQVYSGGDQVVITANGQDATGSTLPGDGGDLDVTVLGYDIPSSLCSSQNVGACVSLQSLGGNSGSANAGVGGAITLQVNSGLTIGSTDPSAAVTSYASGLAVMSLGGYATTNPGTPGTGGNIAITNGAVIAVNISTYAPNPVTAFTPVGIFRQQPVPATVFSFGGGILGYSGGAHGVTQNADGLQHDVTGAAAGSVQIVNTGPITTGSYVGQGIAPSNPTNAGIMALSIGGDSAATEQHGSWIALGQGGAGGNVTVTNSGIITTTADLSPDIFALSEGGSGSSGASLLAGGAGGAVTVTTAATLGTSGNQSSGIVAISAGGNLSGAEQQGIAGPGGSVNVGVGAGATISTSGQLSPGVMAASVAGGLTTSQSQIKDYSTTGGSSGMVKVTNDGTIETTGDGSDGVVAQSVGGGGGTTQVASADNNQYTLGATGAYQSNAANVTVLSAAGSLISVGAAGDSTGAAPQAGVTDAIQDGIGIVAQSIGGGGGIAQITNTAIQTNVGATATNNSGPGNNGGAVAVTNIGTILTYEDGGDGILAQSVGGGGGDGKGKGFILRYGTTGGPGGSGGTVGVVNGGNITTYGWQASGIIAQSIGGGGGAGGSASGFWSGVGGTGGNGGSGGSVAVQDIAGTTIAVNGDDSEGILAQSIGGGGGQGGKGHSIGLFASVAVGGSGGGGGNGADVTVDDDGTIDTGNTTNGTGSQSYGILAQSIGGGGGTAGSAEARSIGALVTVAVGVGGSGGTGGTGGAATVTIGDPIFHDASIMTSGLDADGAIVQSIGGGGGAGGQSSAHSLSVLGIEIPSLAVTIGVGGAAGSGSNGGSAQIDQWGTTTTAGIGAIGLLAQSIGGGGGTAGDSSALASTALTQSGAPLAAINATVGGTGGGTGAGGNVVVDLYANPDEPTTIRTEGDHAHGIVAQSIGGGGGDAGIGDSVAKVGSKAIGVSTTVAIGGTGGQGGAGGTVLVNGMSGISTAGSGADGILAQSIGGGGGLSDGGTAGLLDMTSSSKSKSGSGFTSNLRIGGAGGSGGAGGNVTVNNGAQITTTGGSAIGILAQSIGGGGGAGGSSDPNAGDGGSKSLAIIGEVYGIGSAIYQQAAAGSPDQTTPFGTYGLSVSIGGSGGAGGNGGAVTVSDVAGSVAGQGGAVADSPGGSITTSGDQAYGIVAQSVGGGGGVGGAATAAALKEGLTNFTVGLDLALGGSGGTAGGGGTVSVTNGVQGSTGYAIQTGGNQAVGILAQSIGGGGGIGGAGGVSGGSTIYLGAGIAGSGHAGGDGGMVTVDNYGPITTAGQDAIGILAQSIGGGGGYAGTATTTPGGFGSFGVNVTLGGGNGSQGNAGAVTVTDIGGNITTGGDRAIGILAQAVGGGGGVAATGSASLQNFTFQIGSGSSDSGGSGTVTVGVSGASITTGGAGAHGIVAQAIGGGGGFAGDSGQPFSLGLPASVANGAHASGNGGPVVVNLGTGTSVTTNGANAQAVVAQSVGGGGGIVAGAMGSAGGAGSAGNVTVSLSGATVAANGNGSNGIIAQSVAGSSGSNGQISVALSNASSVRGGNNGAGVVVSGGNGSSSLTIDSTSTLCSYACSPTQNAVFAAIAPPGSGTLKITNYGTIDGLVFVPYAMPISQVFVNNYGVMRLSGTTDLNSLSNNAGGIIDLGQNFGSLNLGSGNVFLNPGSTVIFSVDFLNNRSDQLNVSALYLSGGTFTVRPSNLYPTMPLAVGLTGLMDQHSATSGNTDLIYSFQWILVPLPTELGAAGQFLVKPQPSFTPPGVPLNNNQAAVAAVLQATWNQPPPVSSPQATSDAAVFTSLYGQSPTGYQTALTNLYDQMPDAIGVSTVTSAEALATTLQSCPDFVGPDTLLRENDCVWERNTGRITNVDATNGTGAIHAASVVYQIGGQKEVAPGWLLGGTVGTEQSWESGAGGQEKASGTGVGGGVTLKWQNGPWLASGLLAGGGGSDSSSRLVEIPSMPAVLAKASPSIDYVLGRLRGSYEFAGDRYYAKPSLDFDVIRVHQPGYQESGAGAFDVGYESTSQMLFGVSPQVELGTRINASPDLTLRPYLTLGIEGWSASSWKSTETLLGQSFRVTTPYPAIVGKTALNIDLLHRNGLELKLQYGVDITGISVSQSGFLRLAYKF
jgi:hypothetical protein